MKSLLNLIQNVFSKKLKKSCLPALRESKYGGNIINLVDINAQAPLNQFSVYCGAKSALAMLTKAIALEEAPAVRCNSISPGKKQIFIFEIETIRKKY